MSEADITRRGRIPWVILAVAAPVMVATLVLGGINGSFREEAAFIGSRS